MQSRTLTNIWLISQREFKSRVTKRGIIFPIVFGVIFCLAVSFTPTALYYIQKLSAARNNTTTTNLTTTTYKPSIHVVVLNKAGKIADQDTDVVIAYLENNINANVPAGSYIPPLSGYPTFAPDQINSPYFDMVTQADTSDVTDFLKELKDGKFDVALILERDANGKLQVELHSEMQDGDNTNYDSIFYYLQDALNYLTIHDNLVQEGLSVDQQNELFNSFTISNAEFTPTPVTTNTPTPVSTPTPAPTPTVTANNFSTTLNKKINVYFSNSV